MKRILLCFYILLAITSCMPWEYYSIDEFTINNTAGEIELFVEGGITTQLTYHTIKLEKPGSYINDTEPEYISDANVFIKSITDTINFVLIDSLNGNKLSQPYFRTKNKAKAEVGKSYTLTIEYNDKTYSATDSVVEVEAINYNEIELPQQDTNISSSDGSYTFSIKTHDFGYATPNIWVWIPYYTIENESNYLTNNYIINYMHRGAEPQAVFSLNRSNGTSFGHANDSILTVKYSLSESYYNYLRALFIETDWQESKFSSIPGNLPSNFSKGASGFFFTSDYTTKNITVQDLLDSNLN